MHIGYTRGERTVIAKVSYRRYLCRCSCGEERIYSQETIERNRDWDMCPRCRYNAKLRVMTTALSTNPAQGKLEGIGISESGHYQVWVGRQIVGRFNTLDIAIRRRNAFILDNGLQDRHKLHEPVDVKMYTKIEHNVRTILTKKNGDLVILDGGPNEQI